ncbi:hypothetical protein ABZY42_25505 [Streptomyces sp. NPDC006622]|uniref:hypothetical protein n=1 Tax=Streptomyces sp. NPDC006622 TaxID=3155459 RepID=UPI0033B124EF
MREQPDVDDESSAAEAVEGRKRIDLSLPQVAGGAVAAVVAARLASYFGVYGTILGAGVVSVVATCGGTVFQHFLSRTGEQFREAAVVRRPGPTRAPAPGEYSEGTVHRARVRGWKRPAVAAALVFAVTMGGVTAYELASGRSFSGNGGTTVGDALSGTTASSSGADSDPDGGPAPGSPEPASSDSPVTTGTATPSDDGIPSDSSRDDDGGTTSPEPTASASRDAGAGQDPTPTPTGSVTPPEPSASSRSGTAGQDPADPATP